MKQFLRLSIFLALLVIVWIAPNAQKPIITNPDSIAAHIAKAYINGSWQALSVGVVENDKTHLYNYGSIDANKIMLPRNSLIKTTVFQKNSRTSFDEKENIDHKQIQKNFITISQAGQLSSAK